MLPIRLIAQYPQWQGKALWKIILFDILLGFDNGHLWYLYSLFIIFCLSLFLKKIVKARTLAFIMVFLSLLAIILPFSYLHPLIYHIEANFIWFYLGYILALNNSYLSVIRRKHSVLFFILILLACFSSAAIVTDNRILVFVASSLAYFFLFVYPFKKSGSLILHLKKQFWPISLSFAPCVHKFFFFPRHFTDSYIDN